METTLWSAARLGLDLLLKVTFLVSLVLLFIGGLRRISASARHLLAMLGLAGSLALPFVSPLVPPVRIPLVPSILPAPPKPSWDVVPAARTAARGETRLDTTESASSAAIQATRARDRVEVRRARLERAVLAGKRPALPGPTPLQIVEISLALWVFGAAVSLVRLALGWARLSRIAAAAEPIREPGWTDAADELAERLGLSRPVHLLASSHVPVAMTAGIRRPVLLLHDAARKWPSERRRVVLLHELAHVRRRDWITLLIAELAAAVYWFHPLVWIARREARRSCERACDDLVLETGTKPSVYAAHLLGIVRSLKPVRASALPVMAMARPSQFEGRMRAILDPGLHRRAPSRATTRGAALGALFAVVFLGAFEPWAEKACAAAIGPTRTAGSALLGADPAPPKPSAHEKKPCEAARRRKSEQALIAPSATPEPAGFVLGAKSSNESASDLYSHAMELHTDARYEEAIAAFARAIEPGDAEAASTDHIACSHAKLDRKDEAFALAVPRLELRLRLRRNDPR